MENWTPLIVICLLYIAAAVYFQRVLWPIFLIARTIYTVQVQGKMDAAMGELDGLFDAKQYELQKAVKASDRKLADQILASMDDVSHQRADVAMRLLRESVDQAIDSQNP